MDTPEYPKKKKRKWSRPIDCVPSNRSKYDSLMSDRIEEKDVIKSANDADRSFSRLANSHHRW